MWRAFAAMHQANGQRVPFTLEYGRLAGSVLLFQRFPPPLRPYLETPLVANDPDIAMERVGDDALDLPSEQRQWSVTVRLRPDLFPVKRPVEYEERDPIANLLATLAVDNNAPTVRRESTEWSPQDKVEAFGRDRGQVGRPSRNGSDSVRKSATARLLFHPATLHRFVRYLCVTNRFARNVARRSPPLQNPRSGCRPIRPCRLPYRSECRFAASASASLESRCSRCGHLWSCR